MNTYKSSRNFKPNTKEFILNSSPLYSQQIAIPEDEYERLEKKFMKKSSYQFLQPKIIILNKNLSFYEKINLNLIESSGYDILDNISIDMLYNIPGQSVEIWLKDLTIVSTLKLDHIAIYPLTLEEGTVLFQQMNSGEISPVPEETELQMFTQGSQFLTDSGFTQYEVAHFSKMGKKCRHNQHYWNLEPYLAFGPSAHGYDGKKRWWNVSSLDEYLKQD